MLATKPTVPARAGIAAAFPARRARPRAVGAARLAVAAALGAAVTTGTASTYATAGSPRPHTDRAPASWSPAARLSLGGARLSLSRETTLSGSAATFAYLGDRSEITTLLPAGHLRLGVSFDQRLAAGLDVEVLRVEAPSLTLADGSSAELGRPLTVLFVGPAAEIRPGVRRRFHLGGGPGFLRVSAGAQGDAFGALGGLGAGLGLGLGADLWTSDSLAAGLHLRGMLGRVLGERRAGAARAEEASTLATVTVAASLAYH